MKVFAQVALCRGFQYMASYLSKVTNLHTKRVFGAPPRQGLPHWNFTKIFGVASYLSKDENISYLRVFGAPIGDDPIGIIPRSLASLGSLGYTMQRCFRDDVLPF